MKENNEYNQLCVWPGCVVGKVKKQNEFVAFMKDEFDVRVKYAEEFKTMPSNGEEGGRNELLFYIHDNDIQKFAIKRLMYGISWWEDAKRNYRTIYPYEIKTKYAN